MQINGYSPVQATSFQSNMEARNNDFQTAEMEADSFESSAVKAPKIGFFRILFSRLTKDQIDAVNETKQLPSNAKIIERSFGNTGVKQAPRLTWNLLNVTPGTQQLPAGYELKNDILGFTHLVREGTKSIFYRD